MKHKIHCLGGILFAALIGVLVALFIVIFSVSAMAEESLYSAGVAYNNGNFQRALRTYQKLANKGDLEGYLNTAVIYKDLVCYRDAIYFLKRAQQRFKDDPRVLLLLGRLYFLNHKPDEAISILKKLSEINPKDAEPFIILGLASEEKGDADQAQLYYQKALEFDTSNLVARFSLANIYYRKGNVDEAIEQYKKAGLIDKSIIAVQKVLADVLLRAGRFEDSLRLYQKLKLIEPNSKLINDRISELSDKLGEDFFAKEKQKLAVQRREKIVVVSPFPPVANIQMVRVGIVTGEESLELKSSAPFVITSRAGGLTVLEGNQGISYRVTRNIYNGLIFRALGGQTVIVDEPVVVKPKMREGTITLFNVTHGNGSYWSNQSDRSYRGTIEISALDNGLTAVNVLSLEEYLYSVLPSEMPTYWPTEVLKAQAVAARAEAMRKLGRHKKDGFDFCAEVHCQAYAGVEQESAATTKAVDETRGLVMVFDGQPIDAVYSSNCGGHTQGNIFGDGQDIPYLQSRFDSLENKEVKFPLSPLDFEYWLRQPPRGILCDISEESQKSSFRWVRIYSVSEMNEMLNKLKDFGQIKKIVVLKRNVSGHVSAIKIFGTKANLILEKELPIRQALGNLRSSMFKLEIRYDADKHPEQFIFYGGGWGHGVGMCQSGAFGLAQAGKNYKDILRHYYEGVEFKTIY